MLVFVANSNGVVYFHDLVNAPLEKKFIFYVEIVCLVHLIEK